MRIVQTWFLSFKKTKIPLSPLLSVNKKKVVEGKRVTSDRSLVSNLLVTFPRKCDSLNINTNSLISFLFCFYHGNKYQKTRLFFCYIFMVGCLV